MSVFEKWPWKTGRVLLLLVALFSALLSAHAGSISMGNTDPTFPVLQTKTGTYTNVTVTKKTKDWIFILHSTGVCNVKASDLSTETRIALGYEAPPQKPGDNNSPATKEDDAQAAATGAPKTPALARFARLNLSDVRKFAANWRKNSQTQLNAMTGGNMVPVYVGLGILAGVYIFISTCFWVICRKTHSSPGPLVWVPVLQLIPLLRAANMPRVWFFAFFIPVLNIVAQIIWCVKITKTRGKSPWVAFLLILPPTSLFAFLYLVFSPSAPVEIQSNEVISLETA